MTEKPKVTDSERRFYIENRLRDIDLENFDFVKFADMMHENTDASMKHMGPRDIERQVRSIKERVEGTEEEMPRTSNKNYKAPTFTPKDAKKKAMSLMKEHEENIEEFMKAYHYTKGDKNHLYDLARRYGWNEAYTENVIKNAENEYRDFQRWHREQWSRPELKSAVEKGVQADTDESQGSEDGSFEGSESI